MKYAERSELARASETKREREVGKERRKEGRKEGKKRRMACK